MTTEKNIKTNIQNFITEFIIRHPVKKKWSERTYNPIMTALWQCGFWQCLPFSRTTLREKHCQHQIAVMGVVDTFGHDLDVRGQKCQYFLDKNR